MAEERVKRRLAAILSADVAGFSRLMGEDEAGTLAALKSHYGELIDPAIASFNGRIVKLMGDGALVEFPSIVDAVQCAAEIQQKMAERNNAVPQNRRIEFRIGINLGDVIIEGDDIYGDGVNVAARLEGLAEPCGICIPRKVFQEVRNKLDVGYEYIGEQKVKNIETPVPVYRVVLNPAEMGEVAGEKLSRRPAWQLGAFGGAAALVLIVAGAVAVWSFWPMQADPDPSARADLASAGRPTIAVLPFQNMSSDSNQVHFADGIAEDIITDLSKISGLFVIARNTSFQYRGGSVNVQEVGRKLGVQYILEGSVRRADNQVRITAQLIDVNTNGHVWADRYDGKLADVFSVQDRVTGQIINALKLQLTAAERQAVETRGTNNPSAYDAYLRGMRSLSERRRLDVDANLAAQAAFEEAINLDPNYALAYAGLGWAKWIYIETINVFAERPRTQAFELARKSIKLADNALAHRILAREHFSLLGFLPWTTKRIDLAISELEAAVQLQPNDPDVMADLASALCFGGRPDDAKELIQKAMERNPNHPEWYFAASGISSLFLGEADRAVRELNKWSNAETSWSVPYVFLASALALSGDTKNGNLALAKFDRLSYTLSPHEVTDRGAMQSLTVAELNATDEPHKIRTTFYAVKRKWPMAPEQEKIFSEGLRLAGMRVALE